MNPAADRRIRGLRQVLWMACAIYPSQFATAQFVDLRTEVQVSEWNPGGVRTWTQPFHLVVGTNAWYMDGFFSSNATTTYRFTGTNIVENSVVTKPLPEELLKRLNQPGMLVAGSPAVGTRSTRVIESLDGNPGKTVRQLDSLTMAARIGWLAFCSGPCLKREGRNIFPPSDLWKELVSASAFTDRTSVFDDALGLPKSMDLSTAKNQQVMQYRVTSSTNVLGWQFPLEFYLAQYRPAPVPELRWTTVGTNGWELQFVARGTVRAIGQKAEMPSPDDASDRKTPVSR